MLLLYCEDHSIENVINGNSRGQEKVFGSCSHEMFSVQHINRSHIQRLWNKPVEATYDATSKTSFRTDGYCCCSDGDVLIQRLDEITALRPHTFLVPSSINLIIAVERQER